MLSSPPPYTYIYKIKQNKCSNKAYCYDSGQSATRQFGLQCHMVLEYLADGLAQKMPGYWRHGLEGVTGTPDWCFVSLFPAHHVVRVIFLHSLPHPDPPTVS